MEFILLKKINKFVNLLHNKQIHNEICEIN